ncbi:MAG: hypothetical protein ACREI9_08950 [Nitrospiraceae bacterium]
MPKTIKFSEKTSGLVGYPDGHAEVAVTLPWPLGTHSLRIEANELDDAKRFIDEAVAHRNAVLGLRRIPRARR